MGGPVGSANMLLLSVRFVLIIANIIAVMGVSYDRFFMISMSLRDNVPRDASINSKMDDILIEYTSLESQFKWYLAGMLASNGIEIWGMLLGHCIFHPGLNLASVLFHGWGTFFTLWMLGEAWTIESFTTLWVLTSLLPAIFASVYIIDHVFYQSTYVKRLNLNI